MTKWTMLVLGIVFLAISACTEMVDIEAEKAAIKVILDNYVISIQKEDMELYGKNVAHDTMMVNYGAFGAPIVGWNGLKKVIEGQNEALSGITIGVSAPDIHVSETGKLAWATCLWNFTAMMGENSVALPVRCTWILEKRENRWVIVHFHKSVAAD